MEVKIVKSEPAAECSKHHCGPSCECHSGTKCPWGQTAHSHAQPGDARIKQVHSPSSALPALPMRFLDWPLWAFEKHYIGIFLECNPLVLPRLPSRHWRSIDPFPSFKKNGNHRFLSPRHQKPRNRQEHNCAACGTNNPHPSTNQLPAIQRMLPACQGSHTDSNLSTEWQMVYDKIYGIRNTPQKLFTYITVLTYFEVVAS